MTATLAGATATSQKHSRVSPTDCYEKRCHSARERCQPAGQSVPFRGRNSASFFGTAQLLSEATNPHPSRQLSRPLVSMKRTSAVQARVSLAKGTFKHPKSFGNED